jgi:general secretion pathway protein L
LATATSTVSASASLGAGWSRVAQAWHDMPNWPLFAWMGGEATVRYVHANGSESRWRTNGATRWLTKQTRGRSQFVAVEMPEDWVLRRRLSLPPMACA